MPLLVIKLESLRFSGFFRIPFLSLHMQHSRDPVGACQFIQESAGFPVAAETKALVYRLSDM